VWRPNAIVTTKVNKMCNSQFFADANLLSDLFHRFAALCSEYPEYLNLLVVSAMIFLIIFLGDAILFRLQAGGKFLAKVFVFLFKFLVVTLKRENGVLASHVIQKPTTGDSEENAENREEYLVNGHRLVWSEWRSVVLCLWSVSLASACYPTGYDWRRWTIAVGTPFVVSMLSVRFASERR